MITTDYLDKLPRDYIFASGVLLDNEDGLFMTDSNKLLRWVAVTGHIGDFAVYCHFADKSEEWIKDHGEKVHDERNIRKCLELDDDAFKRYRH